MTETLTMNGFVELDEREMMDIDGGGFWRELAATTAAAAVSGALTGAAVGGTATLGTLAVPAAVAGGVIGGLAGAAGYCVYSLISG